MGAKVKMVCEHVVCSQHETAKSSLASALRHTLFWASDFGKSVPRIGLCVSAYGFVRSALLWGNTCVGRWGWRGRTQSRDLKPSDVHEFKERYQELTDHYEINSWLQKRNTFLILIIEGISILIKSNMYIYLLQNLSVAVHNRPLVCLWLCIY